MSITEEIIHAVRSAGVIGAGGGGFPSYAKIPAKDDQIKIDTVIANGSECEPLLNSDKTLLKEHPDKVIDGLKKVMKATGAETGFISIKSQYKDVISSVQRMLPENKSIKLHLQDNYYPAGDEFLTVFDVTGRVIPEGGLPLQVGVLVNNVVTLSQISDAVNGKPVTERIITVAGSVNQPQVIIVPIGTTYKELINIAGGTINSTDVLVDGGPMMGAIVKDHNMGISKTTSGLIALPEDHIIIQMRNLSVSKIVKRSKAACCQCFRCSDLCPRNLLGHDIFPHKTMRTIDYNMSEPSEHITSAFLCSQCGVCELIACDAMRLSPRKIYAEYKKLLISKGIGNPHKKTGLSVLSELEYRKIPMQIMIKKLDLSGYTVNIPFKGFRSVNKVKIPIGKHIGVPAEATVMPGNSVKLGDIIAESPSGKLGTVYHASIKGKIIEVNEEYIEIEYNGVIDR